MMCSSPFQDLFHNKTGVLATMHQKEQVIAPILEHLGVKIVVPQGLNTDEFGTFSRDIKRPGDQLQAARLKTDMRAMHNPMRMNVIAQATHDLIHKISQCCSQCGFPGFAPIERKAGLPCALCRFPTELTLAVTYGCKKCGFSSVTYFPDGQELADPARCFYCNP